MSFARWTPEQANKWYERQPWLVGCNFTTSTAINQLEMWQAKTFDPSAIERELGWASRIGFNTVRVYLHDLLWEQDEDGFRLNVDHYLAIASGSGIKTLFVLFDDCWNPAPKTGTQPVPKPGVHNSGWVQSPGPAVADDPAQWGRLERYVKGFLKSYGRDESILMWDLYNEPGNNDRKERSLPLLKKVFEWAREADPIQPLTAGLWTDQKELNDFQLAQSDVVTFHNYNDAANLTAQIEGLKAQDRPLVCTEYLARGNNSLFQTHLPIFKKDKVGCINWGLVNGKIQTIYPWGSPENAPEPTVWHHDIFRKDGTPFDLKETDLIRGMTKA